MEERAQRIAADLLEFAEPLSSNRRRGRIPRRAARGEVWPGWSKDQVDLAEQHVATILGFDPFELSEQEKEWIPTGVDIHRYCLVRNHILAKWRQDVTQPVSLRNATLAILPRYHSLVELAHCFLEYNGYINFGVAPRVARAIDLAGTRCGTIIVVGAGLAGLAAARSLMSQGHKVVVLEGRDRPGGRVYTRKMSVGKHQAALDLGGSVMTGIQSNPLSVLAKQLRIPLHRIREECPLFFEGKEVDAILDNTATRFYNRNLLEKANDFRKAIGSAADHVSLGETLEVIYAEQLERAKADVSGDDRLLKTCEDSAGVTEKQRKGVDVVGRMASHEEIFMRGDGQLFRRLINWHFANLEYANAAELQHLSLGKWDQDDPYDVIGDHCFLPGGNIRLIHELAQNVPVFYNCTVDYIRYEEGNVEVHAGQMLFQAEACLVTVPLGILKANSIHFAPGLPKPKLEAIDRLGYGVLNKIILLFPHTFWDKKLDTFGHVNEGARRGEFFLFYSYDGIGGGSAMLAMVAGEAALEFESLTEKEATDKVMSILREIFEPQGIFVPDPLQVICTRWKSDPFSLGSYSYMAPGCTGKEHSILAEAIEDTLFFAGEATTPYHPSTMHGAFLSGLREAGRIARRFRTMQMLKSKMQTPSSAEKMQTEDSLTNFDSHGKIQVSGNKVIGFQNIVGGAKGSLNPRSHFDLFVEERGGLAQVVDAEHARDRQQVDWDAVQYLLRCFEESGLCYGCFTLLHRVSARDPQEVVIKVQMSKYDTQKIALHSPLFTRAGYDQIEHILNLKSDTERLYKLIRATGKKLLPALDFLRDEGTELLIGRAKDKNLTSPMHSLIHFQGGNSTTDLPRN